MKNKILIVDDEPFIVRSLSYVLEVAGYTIETASSGTEAIIRAREFMPDVMFLDVMMPGKNGFEVCSYLKKKDSNDYLDIHIIMLTAMGQEDDRKKSLACGANEYMTKPFSPKELVARVKEIFEKINNRPLA